MADQDKGTCFIIGPIGKPNTEGRRLAEDIVKYVVSPAARACGYTPLWAGHDNRPGIITSQIIEHLIDDPMVIADLTGSNANVFYELSLRHAVRKPVVHIGDRSSKLPFDVGQQRTILFDPTAIGEVKKAEEDIADQIRQLEHDPDSFHNPITQAVTLRALSRSEVPTEKILAEVVSGLSRIESCLSDTRSPPSRRSSSWGCPACHEQTMRLRRSEWACSSCRQRVPVLCPECRGVIEAFSPGQFFCRTCRARLARRDIARRGPHWTSVPDGPQARANAGESGAA